MKLHRSLQREDGLSRITQPVANRSQGPAGTSTEQRRMYAQDFVWEFGWSLDSLECLMPRPQPQADYVVNLLDKALALAG
jgi:hypothetical protein